MHAHKTPFPQGCDAASSLGERGRLLTALWKEAWQNIASPGKFRALGCWKRGMINSSAPSANSSSLVFGHLPEDGHPPGTQWPKAPCWCIASVPAQREERCKGIKYFLRHVLLQSLTQTLTVPNFAQTPVQDTEQYKRSPSTDPFIEISLQKCRAGR